MTQPDAPVPVRLVQRAVVETVQSVPAQREGRSRAGLGTSWVRRPRTPKAVELMTPRALAAQPAAPSSAG